MMAKLEHVVEEIKEMRNDFTHRSSLKIYNLLEGNKKLFSEKMEADDLRLLLARFGELADATAVEYQTENFKRDFQRSYELLLFHLNRF